MEICRACMTNANLQPLFDHKLNNIFENLTTIHLSENDNLPTSICTDCAVRLNEFDFFKNMCLINDKLLKEGSSIKLEHKKNPGDENVKNRFQEDDMKSILDTILDTNNDNESTLSHNKNKDLLSSDEETPLPNDEPFSDYSDSRDEKYTPPIRILPKNWKKNELLKKKINYNTKKGFAYECEICSRGFYHFERYEGHLREHSGKKPAVCQYCGHDFTWTGLRVHIKKIHPKETESKCQICNQICVNDSAMQAHLSIHNRRQRQFVCETCGKEYHDLFQLKSHLVIHQTETPFECDHCGKKYKREKTLKEHKKRHEGIKKFPCKVCGKTFAVNADLRQHNRSHDRVKKCNFATLLAQ